MSWLISAIIFGLAVASDDNLPVIKEQPKQAVVSQISQPDETERIEQTYPLTADGRISVSNINGPIVIEAWDRNEVKLVAVKTADTRENLKDLKVKINAQPNSFKIDTDIDNGENRGTVWNGGSRNQSGTWHNGKYYRRLEVAYQLTVPRGATLNEIESVNGSITVSNLTNYTKVSAVNGEVRASNLTGTANLSTVNGTVEADFSTLRAGSQIELSTVNGRANLMIPSDANATIKAETVNGSIVNDFGLPVRKGEYVGRDLYGRVGSGDIKIKLESVNGGLNIRRRADGKNPNPVTNLLQSAEAQDSDADSRAAAKASARTRTPRPRAPIAPNVVIPKVVIPKVEIPEINIDISEEVRAGMESARVEMEKAQVELSNIKIDINQAEINRQVREARRAQRDALAQMRELGWSPSAPFYEKKSESFPVKGVPEIVVNGGDCAVTVRGWDKQEVRYSILRVAPNRPNGTTIDEKVSHTDSKVVIDVEDASGDSDENFNRMKIEVFVPKKSNLKINTAGEIRLENISGKVELEGADEAINVRDAEGTLAIKAGDGRMRVIGFRGELDAENGDGTMMLEGNFSRLNAQTGDGTIILSLPENTGATLETNSQNVAAEGVSLTRLGGNEEHAFKWQIGKGGNPGVLNTNDDGRIIVRSINQMQSR